MNQHPQNSAGDKILTFVNSGFTTLSTACFPKSSINWRRQTQNSQTWKIHLPQGFFFMGIPNNHQNTMYKCWKSTFKGWSNFTACAYICWQAIPRPPFGTLSFLISISLFSLQFEGMISKGWFLYTRVDWFLSCIFIHILHVLNSIQTSIINIIPGR